MLCTKEKLTVPTTSQLYSKLKQWRVKELSELCTFLCLRHAPRSCNYFVIFNLQNNLEKYTDYPSPSPFCSLGSEDFENLNNFSKITQKEAYDARI